jgi:serine kinase
MGDSFIKSNNFCRFTITSSEVTELENRGYKVVDKICSGYSGIIYLLKYTRKDKPEIPLACKVVDKMTAEPKFLRKFLPRETTILAKLNNPHVIQVQSILETKFKWFMFMRWAENGDLSQYLTNHGPIPEDHIRMWVRQLILAIKYLHGISVAHRDIKCENILITGNLNAKLADFGFARSWRDEGGNDLMSGTYCGTPSYAAPEVLLGRPYVPKYCDIWSAGVVFFIMANMKKPFDRRKAQPILKQQWCKEYKFSSKANLSPSGRDLLRIMLEPEVTLRATPDTVLSSEWMSNDPLLVHLVPDS